jgi:hypothetical protein
MNSTKGRIIKFSDNDRNRIKVDADSCDWQASLLRLWLEFGHPEDIKQIENWRSLSEK